MSAQSPGNPVSDIREIENIWIPTRDGTRLAGRLWLPRDAGQTPVPAILEYLPYRKRDFMRERDEPMHRYFARAGYASLRVDLRGSGDSQGVLLDEYEPTEHEDAIDIIAWIAAQDWCSGAVGMTGISWGGFNALQVAALRPPALKAIISLCASDDRYADDAHYKGGCLLNENLQWGAILTLYNALPPDPEIVGEDWHDMWLKRLNVVRPMPGEWMRHPARDDYWRQGSICEDYAAVTCPVYAIGGWADGYTNAIPRLMAGLRCPRKALVGPWAHMFPHLGVPGPAIGYLQEAVRWWDHWLKGQDTGIMREPMLRAWIQEPVKPQSQYETRPGRWVAETGWPSDRIRDLKLYPQRGRLDTVPSPEQAESVSSEQSVGQCGGEWCGFGANGEAPLDQRPDDEGSLVFDSAPFETETDLLGVPVFEAELSADQPSAQIVVRVCDVAPDGASLRISYGILNLAFRRGFERAEKLVPGKAYAVTLELDFVGHKVRPGHRLRLSVSTSYWPLIWPAAQPFVLSLITGPAYLRLPVRPPSETDPLLKDFGPPLAAPGASYIKLIAQDAVRRLDVDSKTKEFVHIVEGDGGEFGGASLARLEEIDLELSYWMRKKFRIREGDPLSARASFSQRAMLRRGDWHVAITCEIGLSGTKRELRLDCRLSAKLQETPVFERAWSEVIPRQL